VENTRVQPGGAVFVPLRRTNFAHIRVRVRLGAADGDSREGARSSVTRETFLSIGGRPARLGPARRAGRVTLSSRVDTDTAPSPSASPSERRSVVAPVRR